jgi:hypothetical protein
MTARSKRLIGIGILVLLVAVAVGGTRVVDMLSGEQLPRIC